MSAYQISPPQCNFALADPQQSRAAVTAPVAGKLEPPRPYFRYKPGWTGRIPDVLKQHPCWVLWKYLRRTKSDGTAKWTKMPVQARDRCSPASATDPATWSSFDEALRAFEASAGEVDGLGFVLGRMPGVNLWISGVDFDDCIDPEGRIADWAQFWLDNFNSYAEYSPSGRGFKIFVRGRWDDGESYETLDGCGEDGMGRIEIAQADRFFTVTGDRVDARRSDLPAWGLAGMVLYGLHLVIQRENRGSKNLSGSLRPDAADAGKPIPREELAGLSPIEKFLTELDAMGISHKPCGDGFTACCPVHADSNPSMTFKAAEDRRLLVYCHGCDARLDKIMPALGLLPQDAFPDCDSKILLPRRPRGTGPVSWSGYPGISPELIERMTAHAEHYLEELLECPEKLTELESRLGVPEEALLRLGVGWKQTNWRRNEHEEWIDDGPAWTFPEQSGEGEIIGIQRRYVDESIDKRAISGSKRGLSVPAAWEEIPGPVFIPEGASDVAALISVGLCAIGRPSATGGIGHLARFLRGVDRRIIVLGENDRKADGRWPGKEGAETVARALERELKRQIEVGFPPEGFKDVRAYVQSRRDDNEEA
jgi:hypothetical protein